MRMTRTPAAIIMAVVFLAIALFTGFRLRETRSVQDGLNELERKASQLLASSAETELLRKRFPPQADVSSFFESLSALARSAGFRDLEITTLPPLKRAPAARPRREADPSPLVHYPFKIAFEGSYRATAEFLRQVQGMERYTRIVQFELKPSKHAIRVLLIIEITSFEAADAA